jgi:hypothetical protein
MIAGSGCMVQTREAKRELYFAQWNSSISAAAGCMKQMPSPHCQFSAWMLLFVSG